MNPWLEFILALAFGGAVLYGLWCDFDHWWQGRSHEDNEWVPSLLVHVAYDGEVIEYPTTWECSADDVVDWLGKIEALPEAVEA